MPLTETIRQEYLTDLAPLTSTHSSSMPTSQEPACLPLSQTCFSHFTYFTQQSQCLFHCVYVPHHALLRPGFRRPQPRGCSRIIPDCGQLPCSLFFRAVFDLPGPVGNCATDHPALRLDLPFSIPVSPFTRIGLPS